MDFMVVDITRLYSHFSTELLSSFVCFASHTAEQYSSVCGPGPEVGPQAIYLQTVSILVCQGLFAVDLKK